MAEQNTTTVDTPTTPEGSGRFGTSLLTTLGLDGDAVLGGQNVAQTVTSPVSAPTDVLGIFQQQDDLAGVSGLQTNANTAQQNFLDAQNLANQQQVTLQGRRNKLGVMRGQQAEAGAQANMDLQTLGTANTLAQNALAQAQQTALQKANLLYAEYQTKQQLLIQYPGLDIDPFSDDMGKVTEKLEEYQKDAKKTLEKDGYKEALRNLGLSTKGSRRELEKRLTSANKDAADLVRRKTDLELQSLENTIASQNQKLTAGSTDDQLDSMFGTTGDSSGGTSGIGGGSVNSWLTNWYGGGITTSAGNTTTNLPDAGSFWK